MPWSSPLNRVLVNAFSMATLMQRVLLLRRERAALLGTYWSCLAASSTALRVSGYIFWAVFPLRM